MEHFIKKPDIRHCGVFILTCFCILTAILFLSSSQIVGSGVREGLRLCSDVVIPSLFPFMVLSGFMATSRISSMLNKIFSPITKYVFRLPVAAASPLLMGWVGGYPVGARTLTLMVNQRHLSEKTASRMLCFCVNAGPPFLMCAVGASMFGSMKLGILLLAAQFTSSLIIGIALGLLSKKEGEPPSSPPYRFRPYSICFVQSVNDASAGMISICSFVILFSAITSLLTSTGAITSLVNAFTEIFPALNSKWFEACIFGVLEVTTGCKALSEFSFSGLHAAAALLSFSGLSVICQVLAAVHGSGINVKPFLISRIFHGMLTLFVFDVLLRIFPQTITVFERLGQPIAMTSGTAASSFSLLAMCAVFLLTTGGGNNTLIAGKPKEL